MSNNVMFSNKEALRKAVERVEWKFNTARSFFFTDPVYGKYANGQYGFDARDLLNLYTFFVELGDYDDKSEEERLKHFNREASKIAHVFFETHGEKKGKPDYKSVEPYIRRMYDEVDEDLNIDWDNVDAIEHLLSGWYLQQTLGTMAEKFAEEFAKNFTLEEKKKIDRKMQATFANQRILQSKFVQENSQYSKRLSKGEFDEGTSQYFIEVGVCLAVAKASKDGYDPIVLDPEHSEVFKNYFVNDTFEMEETGELASSDVFNQNDAITSFFESLSSIAGKGAFEHMAVLSAKNDKGAFLMVDGKPVSDYIQEHMSQGMTKEKARYEAGKWLRSALLDGNSVVTVMRPIVNENGTVTFQHQQIKTDLDKVNAIDRAENYGWFRRALDTLRIYRIPKKCASNKERDAAQAKKMDSTELQNALKAVEDKFIEGYNEKASQPNPNNLQSAFPKISRIEAVQDHPLSEDAPVSRTETEPLRMSLNLSNQDLENPVSSEPNEPKVEEPVVAAPEETAPVEETKEEPVAEARARIENSNIVVEAPEVEELPKIEELPEIEEQPKVEEKPTVEVKPQVEETHIADMELTVGENITPAEFASIYDKADKSVRNSQLTESVKGQMREILAGSGADNTKIDETVDKVFQTGLFDSDDGIAAYYNHLKADMSASAKSRSSSSIMEMMIRGAGNNIRLALNGSFSNAAEQMIVHQKLLDVLLKNYSPAAFSKSIDEKYLNNYFLDDSKNLESYYRTYINKNASEADVEGFAKGVSELRVNEEGANRIKAEEEAKRKAEEEEARRKEEEAKRKAEEEEARRKAEEETKRKAEEEEARRKAEEEIKRKAEEEEARRKAEEEEKRKAEEEKQRQLEEQRLKEQYKQEEAKRLDQHATKNKLESEIEARLNERRAAEEKEVLESQKSQKSQNSLWKRFMTKEPTKEETGTIHSWKEAYDLLYDKATREETKKAIMEMVRETQAKAPGSMVEEFVSVAVNVSYEVLGNKLTSSTTWDRFNEARTPEAKEMAAREYAIEAFRIVYDSLGLINYHETEDDIAKSDRWILAQNIADLMLNKYSPIASGSQYAKYGDGYFSKHPDPTVLGIRFTKQSELKDVVATVSKETNMAVPNVDYELVDLVATKKALDETIYESGYQYKLRIVTNSFSVKEAIQSQIADILKVNADIGEHRLPEKAGGIFEADLKDAQEHCKAMDGKLADAERDDMMRNFARDLFESTYMLIRNNHVYYDENMVHRVIAAQKITDLILSSFTPAKFDAVKYGKYADSYAFNNEEVLRETLENLGEECTDSDEAFAEFMKELNKARGLTSEIEETTNEEPEEAIEETGETDRESIPGLKDDVEGKESTEKSDRVIDEKNKKAPSLNND